MNAPKKKQKKLKKKTNKNINKNAKKNVKKKVNKKVIKKIDPRKRRARARFLKWTGLIILIVTIVLLILLSDLFNINEINVVNNNRISSEEIIRLSGIQVNEKMFKFLKIKAKEGIKTNPYIENVKIHRKLNRIIEINVEERVPTFMLVKEEDYYYINNQGYILEKSSEKNRNSYN